MLYTITVLNFVSGTVHVYKNVTLEIGQDAEGWLHDNTHLDIDNCQWMATESDEFEIVVEDNKTRERYNLNEI
jgi:hypothetical protein